MASLKKNVIFSTILTISNYLFPIITFPYVTRVLGVNMIGICNFVDSIVNYFIIFSMMGMVSIGIREVAKSKGDKVELSRVYSSLITLNLIFSFIAIFVLLAATLLISQLREYDNMFYIGAGKILANTLLIEWLYKGLENFKFITARTIIIRSIYVLSVLIFVKHPSDYVLYFGLTTLSIGVNAVVNIFYSRHFVSFSLRGILIKPYLKSFFVLGIYLVLTNFYTTFNVSYLGFVTNTTEVGYYSTATKLYSIIMGFFTAFTGVMMPRMSSLIAEGRQEELKHMIKMSIDILLSFALPVVIISEVCTPEIISLVAGAGYEGAILPMKIVMPLMLVIGYEQILILQILMPMNQDAAILRNSIVGAVVALVFNVLLVSHFGSVGTAIVWILSEFSVLVSAQYYVTRFLGMKFPYRSFSKRILIAFPVFSLGYAIEYFFHSGFLALVLISVVVIFIWFTCEAYVLNNMILRITLRKIIDKYQLKHI